MKKGKMIIELIAILIVIVLIGVIGFGYYKKETNNTQNPIVTMEVKDLGTILVGKMAVEEGIIDEVGGVSEALFWLHQEIERSRKKRQEKK